MVEVKKVGQDSKWDLRLILSGNVLDLGIGDSAVEIHDLEGRLELYQVTLLPYLLSMLSYHDSAEKMPRYRVQRWAEAQNGPGIGCRVHRRFQE